MAGFELFVLEANWSRSLRNQASVAPFFKGLEAVLPAEVFVNHFESSDTLRPKLARAFARPTPNSIVYIAGHGAGSKLHSDYHPDINLKLALGKAVPKSKALKGAVSHRGLLLGSCEIGSPKRLRDLLNASGPRLAWVAGYAESVPWVESTVCDLLFLTYLVVGRSRRQGRRLRGGNAQHTTSPETAARWVLADYPLARMMGFSATER